MKATAGGFQDDLFGEGGLAGQLLRMASATTVTDCVLLHVEKKAMVLAMSLEPKSSVMFVKCLVKRNIRYQGDLVDQLFNASEKRLARVLLLMAHFGKEGVSGMPKTESGDSGRVWVTSESPLGNSAQLSEANEDDAVVKWDDDGRVRLHQPWL